MRGGPSHKRSSCLDLAAVHRTDDQTELAAPLVALYVARRLSKHREVGDGVNARRETADQSGAVAGGTDHAGVGTCGTALTGARARSPETFRRSCTVAASPGKRHVPGGSLQEPVAAIRGERVQSREIRATDSGLVRRESSEWPSRGLFPRPIGTGHRMARRACSRRYLRDPARRGYCGLRPAMVRLG